MAECGQLLVIFFTDVGITFEKGREAFNLKMTPLTGGFET